MIIPDKKKLDQIKKNIRMDGVENLYIISDFDRTLTYGSVNGVSTPSIQSLLRDGKHLIGGYAKKAHQLFDKYAPIENDHSIPFSQRKKAMQEWWTVHNELMIDSGLSLADLEDIVENGNIRVREGVADLLKLTRKLNIPLIIMSSSGCGEAIPMFMKKWFPQTSEQVHYVLNRFEWDEQGNAVDYKKPIIHIFNKDETTLKDIPEIYGTIKNRHNLILLGDSVGDVRMGAGIDHHNVVRVGLLNYRIDEDIDIFKNTFDIVLTGDGDLGFVVDLIKDLMIL